MREISLREAAARQLSQYCSSFYERDIETSIRSFTPGEWVIVKGKKREFIGFINPLVTQGPCLRVVCEKNSERTPLEIVEYLLSKSLAKRSKYIDYKNYRLCYGDSDFLPGLIVDVFQNYVLIQINTAGLDKYRLEIKDFLIKSYPSKKVVLFDKAEYRKNELLPEYEVEEISDVEILENDFKYSVSAKTIQKVGYYFDHRENRLKLENFLKRIESLESGVDLFSYVGSWGLHLLRGGVGKVEFVDQADMQTNIENNLKLNNFEGRGSFTRSDVFSYLEQCLQNNNKFDIIVSDPPAFSKSERNVKKALGGYEKLHTKALKVIKDNGYYIAASCTHGVSLEDLDRTVSNASLNVGKTLSLLDIGVQGFDHPFESLKSKAFYIKYLLYQVCE
ncbi:conserved hypothetical protein [Halobacteriovorax marinus SJ]|uniref:Uncharacterized protein n=1 Tax=Halobacteriovorax marinus (strain ATCC BAA-682 / DSM 15412 / SJ) TaxID=862908 RepID=E1X292_HALMS|nr:class I SAM-dependent methyltransferase [Halobacteriovorax marinus]CBW25048.1 conserved hypothetical protein [Halobacteriovorax marinus SJ]